MTVAAIRKKLVDYLQIADDKKVKAIYAMVEDEIDTEAHELDDHFLSELESRRKSYLNGTVRMYTFEETKAAAAASVATRK